MALNTDNVLTIILLSFILVGLFVMDYTNAAGLTEIPSDLEQAQSDLAKIQERQKEIEARVAKVHAEEERLGRLVQELKQNKSGLTQTLQDLRLGRALRRLRDLLLELRGLHREQEHLEAMKDRSREQIRNGLSHRADDLLKVAEELFKARREGEANALYQQALGLMEEYQHLSEYTIPPVVDEVPAFDPIITGREGPAELRQMSVLLRHEAEETQRQLTHLDQIAQRIRSDLAFEKRALRFQGLQERESEQGIGQAKNLGDRGIAQERGLEAILGRAKENRERIQHLLERAEELEKIAAKKEKLLLERKNQ